MAGFKYVDGNDGKRHVQKVQFFRTKSLKGKPITIHLAGECNGQYNNFGFKHLLFPSKKANPTPLATKVLNKAKRRADVDVAGQDNAYRSGWTRQAWGQPAREHPDDTHAQGWTKYGRKISKSTFNSYIDTTLIPFDEILVVFASACDAEFGDKVQAGEMKEVNFKFRTAAVLGVDANGNTAAPSSSMTVLCYKKAKDVYHLLHLTSDNG